jgi:hypothetical protein
MFIWRWLRQFPPFYLPPVAQISLHIANECSSAEIMRQINIVLMARRVPARHCATRISRRYDAGISTGDILRAAKSGSEVD